MAQGKKTGGRQQGTPNAATFALREQVEKVSGGPLPVLLATIGAKAMKDKDLQLAVIAFSKAATYVYPRLNALPPPTDPKDYKVTFKAPQIVAPSIVVTREVIGKCVKCGGPEQDHTFDPSGKDKGLRRGATRNVT